MIVIKSNPSQNSDSLVISHAADIDGMGGAILAKLIHPNIDIILSEIGELEHIINDLIINGDFQQYKNIYIVDLPLRGTLPQKINDNSNPNGVLVHFDHHASEDGSSQYEWSTTTHKIGDFLPSGTSLFYGYLIKQYPNHPLLNQKYTASLVENIRSYDTWDWAKTNNLVAKDLTDLFIQLKAKHFITHFCNKIHQSANDNIQQVTFDSTERLLIEALKEDIAEHIILCDRSLMKIKMRGYKFGFVITEKYRSDVGNVLSKKYKDELDGIIIIDFMRKTISLRGSKKDVDLSQIAKAFGGGGQPQAAGMPIEHARIMITTRNNAQIEFEFSSENELEDIITLKKEHK
jgi:oligoribonuclease NrnB/cAMP/cGMP phosphodiesterase (DHH superfamily)